MNCLYRTSEGTIQNLSAAEARTVAAASLSTTGNGALLWVHVERGADGYLPDLAALPVALPEMAVRALTATESRPRCELLDDGVLLNLRVPAHPDLSNEELAGADALVSLRLWATRGAMVSVSVRRSAIIEPVLAQFKGATLRDAGDVLIAIAVAVGEAIDPIVAGIGDELDDVECKIDGKADFALRRQVTALRTRAVELRRFVQPQRQALDRLAQLPIDWLDDLERASVREGSDRFARMTEELESIRERAAVLHDELTDLRSERLDTRSLQIAIVALIFLPLTFVTGLLGMNVDGIPLAREPWAFWGVTVFCAIIALAVAAWFAWRGWSEGR